MTANLPPLQPNPLNYAQPVRSDLRKIASRQRGIIFSILANLVFLVLSLRAQGNLKPVFLVGWTAASVCGTVFVFMLAIALYNTGMGVVLGILGLVPVVGLLVLLRVNAKATATLRRNGVKVGLLGADPKTIPTTY